MKIVTIVGARPQFVKAATISRVIRHMDGISEVIIHTGQHYDQGMSEVFFKEMDIPHPNYNLNINNMSHGKMTGKMLEQIEDILQQELPDVVLVYGDTNSTLAGALASVKIGIPVAHVEAGLRSFNMSMPEEINRILTDRISSFLFCPTELAMENLSNEGFSNINAKVMNVGDVMYDAALYYKEQAISDKYTLQIIRDSIKDDFGLVTIHRAENTNEKERLKTIVTALNSINCDLKLICPLHPRTKKLLEEYKLKCEFTIITPVSYFEMLNLLYRCKMVFTDSGGLQKEAYFFQKPCITLRDETEWQELVDLGYNYLAGANKTSILQYYNQLKNSTQPMKCGLYGDGNAAELIVKQLLNSNRC